jgi:hypothetical protein
VNGKTDGRNIRDWAFQSWLEQAFWTINMLVTVTNFGLEIISKGPSVTEVELPLKKWVGMSRSIFRPIFSG